MLASLRVLPGRHGTWLSRGGTSVLVDPGTDLDHPPADLASSLTEWFGTEDEHSYGVTVMLTTRCNLSCTYCFQNMPPSDGLTGRIAVESLDVGRLGSICRFVERQVDELGKSGIDLLLTGGEPLLAYRECCALLEQLRPVGVRAAQMFTNATLLTARRARGLAEAGLTSMQVSLDGWQADHDRQRVDAAGRGTFERILRNVVEAVDAAPGIDYTFRINVSASSAPGLGRLVTHLATRFGPGLLSLRFGLLDDVGVGFDGAPAPADVEHDLLAAMLLAADLGFVVEPLASVEDCLFCGGVGGTSGCVINADGTLYSCWESVGQADMAVGDVTRGYLAPEALEGRWVDCSYNVVTGPGLRADRACLCDALDVAVLDHAYERSLLGAA